DDTVLLIGETAVYLMDCAVQAGHSVDLIDISRIGVDANGRFTDEQDRVIDRCFKLYPWEDMLREPFSAHLKPGVFVEPAWKAILSNKAMMPLLWARNEGHPNLLPTYFEGDTATESLSEFVVKPFFSREGENVAIHTRAAPRAHEHQEGVQSSENDTVTVVELAEGDYGEERRIVQAYAPLWTDRERHAVLGVWMVGDRAAGLGMREDASRITRNLSRFVPHVILDAASLP
ncbi:MAG: glutathionylspermidine synthase family protein, partial [Pseudomonadota bacterium]